MAVRIQIPTEEQATIGPGRRINFTDEAAMGDVRVEIEVENTVDRELVYRGLIAEVDVRQARVRAIVDSGAVMLVLPQEVVENLGLCEMRRVVVTYADGRKEERPIVGTVTVRVGDRSATVDCFVGPPGSEVVLTQILLVLLDLWIDCGRQQLVPRPESPLLPLINM